MHRRFHIVFGLASLVIVARTSEAQPIQLHPQNPHVFEWRGKPTVLIGSTEHYGAVLNPDLDYAKYLATLEAQGMRLTRVFAGTYVEPPGAFGIERNTLAPAKGRYLAPWARSDQPGYAGGGTKFDLERFNPAYFERLKAFVAEADRRGVVVELTLFCSTYGDAQWAIHPMNGANNVNDVGVADFRKLHTPDNGNASRYQESFVRKVVRELNGFDNLFFEIQNEPYPDQPERGPGDDPKRAQEHPTAASVAWQSMVAGWISDEESRLPRKHLIAQNVANNRLGVLASDLAPGVSIVNFHYAVPEAAEWNQELGLALGDDETGFQGRENATYRQEAWNFLLSGGALFDHLDYSFSVGHEDGNDVQPKSPGGGSRTLRAQLKLLNDLLHSFDVVRMKPDRETVSQAKGVSVRGLSDPGNGYLFLAKGKAPAELTLTLPPGRYSADWIEPASGRVIAREEIDHSAGERKLASPAFDEEVALVVRSRQ